MRIPTKQDKGFTLIELLVVVVIIGVLAAIAIPVFLNQREKAADSATKSDLKNAATLMETYYVDAQDYGTAGGVNSAAAQLADFKNSENVEVTVTVVGDTGYCLTGTNDAGSGSFTYDSTNGGLSDVDVACPATIP